MIFKDKLKLVRLTVLTFCTVMWCAMTPAAEESPVLPPAVMAPPSQPAKMPDFEFANLHGGTLKSSELKGKVVVMRFWATWCDICRGEMPSLQKAYRDYPAKDVVVMTISLDGGDGTAVKKFLDENKYTMPSAHDKGMAYGRQISARGVPMTFIIDRNQNIVSRGLGPVELDRPDVKKIIQNLVAQPRT